MGKNEYIEAGRVTNTHGVAGELRLELWLDSPELLKKCGRLFIGGRELKILSARPHKDAVILRLEGVGDVGAASALKGATALIRRDDAKLPAGAFFVQELIGARVLSEDGAELGVLEDVMETPASRVYIVRGETEHLIPDVPEFIRAIDGENGVITVHIIDGM